MLNLVNIIYNYIQALIGLARFNLHKELILIFLVADEPNRQFLSIRKLFHRSTTWLLDPVINLEAVFINQLIFEHADHFAEFFIFLSVLHNYFTELLDSLIFANNLIFQSDYFFSETMFWTVEFVDLGFNIQLLILILQNLFIQLLNFLIFLFYQFVQIVNLLIPLLDFSLFLVNYFVDLRLPLFYIWKFSKKG